MTIVQHSLVTTRLGDVRVAVPSSWPKDYGFILIAGSLCDNPIVRIQSRCAYGDVFGSLHCDCAQQLDAACAILRNQGGLLFYLEQEGRGAGGAIKARAYRAHETEGVDTFQFYKSIHLSEDMRDYAPVADALRQMNICSIRLLTNNPMKIDAVQSRGIAVTHLPLAMPDTKHSKAYLLAKRQHGHLL